MIQTQHVNTNYPFYNQPTRGYNFFSPIYMEWVFLHFEENEPQMKKMQC
jgi:hypothetical protein